MDAARLKLIKTCIAVVLNGMHGESLGRHGMGPVPPGTEWGLLDVTVMSSSRHPH